MAGRLKRVLANYAETKDKLREYRLDDEMGEFASRGERLIHSLEGLIQTAQAPIVETEENTANKGKAPVLSKEDIGFGIVHNLLQDRKLRGVLDEIWQWDAEYYKKK